MFIRYSQKKQDLKGKTDMGKLKILASGNSPQAQAQITR
jgi:hypothetical protein